MTASSSEICQQKEYNNLSPAQAEAAAENKIVNDKEQNQVQDMNEDAAGNAAEALEESGKRYYKELLEGGGSPEAVEQTNCSQPGTNVPDTNDTTSNRVDLRNDNVAGQIDAGKVFEELNEDQLNWLKENGGLDSAEKFKAAYDIIMNDNDMREAFEGLKSLEGYAALRNDYVDKFGGNNADTFMTANHDHVSLNMAFKSLGEAEDELYKLGITPQYLLEIGVRDSNEDSKHNTTPNSSPKPGLFNTVREAIGKVAPAMTLAARENAMTNLNSLESEYKCDIQNRDKNNGLISAPAEALRSSEASAASSTNHLTGTIEAGHKLEV
jgi:hypothetical protein